MDSSELLRWIIGGVLFVIFSYGVVRGVTFAYFRSKFEHLRRVMKELREGDR